MRHYFLEVPQYNLQLHPGGTKPNKTATRIVHLGSKTHLVLEFCQNCLDELLVKFYDMDQYEWFRTVFPFSNCEFLAHTLLKTRQFLSAQYVVGAVIVCLLLFIPFVWWAIVIVLFLVVGLFTYNNLIQRVQYGACDHCKVLRG